MRALCHAHNKHTNRDDRTGAVARSHSAQTEARVHLTLPDACQLAETYSALRCLFSVGRFNNTVDLRSIGPMRKRCPCHFPLIDRASSLIAGPCDAS